MDNPTIDREFESLCGALSHEEITRLTLSLKTEGCREPLITWANHEDTILDGYNRYRICKRYGIPFKRRAIRLETREDALNWIANNQLGRRNLDASQRAMLATKLETAKQGRPNKHANLHDFQTTRAEAAEQMNVSERSVASAAKVLEKGIKPLQKAVETREVSVSAAAAVAELPPAQQKAAVAKGEEGMTAAAKKVKERKAKKPRTPKPEPTEPDWKGLLDLVGQVRRAADTCNRLSGRKGKFCEQFQDTCGILDDIVRDWRKVTK